MRNDPNPFRSVIVLAAVLTAAACGTVERGKVQLELMSPAAVDLARTDSLFLTNFVTAGSVPGLDLDKELNAYWQGELAVRFKGKLKTPVLAFGPEGLSEDAAFWRQVSGGAERSVILTGRFAFTVETRQAVVDKTTGSIQEPFVKTKDWEVRQSFTLEARLVLLAGDTGRAALDRVYKESAVYPGEKEPPRFALSELLQTIKIRFFRDAFGAPHLQDRYLLNR
jgi:hypothetical protein